MRPDKLYLMDICNAAGDRDQIKDILKREFDLD
jgi:hypothetical protein